MLEWNESMIGDVKTYLVVMRGIIAPLVMVSTRMRKGMIDRTL
jgi:hypothetical protein